jgi:Uma2 family endonuclease
MNIVLREPWTVERFLAWEDEQEGRHEFDGSHIIPLTGGSRAHQRIVFNLQVLLHRLLYAQQYDIVAEMRIALGGKVRYPDIAVCAGRIPDAARTLRDAIVLFEVLSDETAAIDRSEKRRDYATLPGLRHYVLIEQDCIAAVALSRDATGWTETSAAMGTIALPALGIALPLAAIHEGLDFAPGA